MQIEAHIDVAFGIKYNGELACALGHLVPQSPQISLMMEEEGI